MTPGQSTTTYRERREARAERLREWADEREARAEASFGAAHELADSIPFGQPILVGHHSEARARRDRDRIHNGISRAVEHSHKAERFREKAANIEAAAAHAIYSDDEDAVDRLRERIAGLEAERYRIKAYNASCRKGSPDESLLDDAQRASLESVRRYSPYQLGKGGAFPSYALSNLNGNLNRQKKRLGELR